MTKKAQRDHYVSQAYLRQWCIESEQIFAGDKVERRIFSTGTQSVCVKRENSTNPVLDDPRFIEKIFLKVEGDLPHLIKRVSNCQISGQVIERLGSWLCATELITPTGKRLLSANAQADYFAALHRNQLGLDAIGEAFVRNGKKYFIPLQMFEPDGRPIFPVSKDFQVKMHAFGVQRFDDFLQQELRKRWIFVRAPFPTSFITSDHPFARVSTPAGPGIFTPIATNLGLIRRPLQSNETTSHGSAIFTETDASGVDALNIKIAQSAERYVFASSSGHLESLLGRVPPTDRLRVTMLLDGSVYPREVLACPDVPTVNGWHVFSGVLTKDHLAGSKRS